MRVLERNERQLIGNGARALLDQAGGLARARRCRTTNKFDQPVWAQMAGLGWFGMPVPEALGGSDLVIADTVELFEALGAGLAPEPVVPVIAGAFALSGAGTNGAHALLKPIIEGGLVPLFMPGMADGAGPDVVGGRLNGRTGVRTDLHAANAFIVAAQTADGPALFFVAHDRPGIELELKRTIDGGTIGCLSLHDVDVASLPVLARGNAVEPAMLDAADVERLGHAAMLVGLMDRALTMTADYMRTRVQFGAPIGSFQALQHRAASVHVDVASSRSIVREGALAVGSRRQKAAAAAAKAYASTAALRATNETIQLHGAIGFTDEHDIGLFHRRATALAAADGGVAAARAVWIDERGRFYD